MKLTLTRLSITNHSLSIAAFLFLWLFLNNNLCIGADAGSLNKFDTISVSSKVAELRYEALQAQREYVSSLIVPKGEISASDYLDVLRSDLKRSILELVRNGGSEVEIAIKRSVVEFWLNVVNSYEIAFGIKLDFLTTRWNLFSMEELSKVEDSLKVERGKLTESMSKLPSNHVPSSTLGRLQDIRTEMIAIQLEKTFRQGEAKRPAPSISDLTIEQAEDKFPSLRLDHTSREKLAERLLLYEIEYRQVWNPEDYNLKAVAKDIREGPHKSALLSRFEFRLHPDSWPTRTSFHDYESSKNTHSDSPLPPPEGDSIQELSKLAKSELDATRRGDARGRAEARAKAAIHGEFIQVLSGDNVQNAQQLALASMPDEELESLLKDYQDWEKSLIEAKSKTTAANWFGEIELQKTGKYVQAIITEKEARSPPPDIAGFHGPEQIKKVLENFEAANVEAQTYKDQAELKLERERLLNLQLEYDLPRKTPDTTLEESIEIQKARVLKSEADLLNKTLLKIEKLISSNLQNGRSDYGHFSAKLTLGARDMLRGQAQALNFRIANQARKSQHAAEILVGTTLHPKLLAPPPVGLSYDANRTSEILFRLNSAEGILANPRAPPIIIDISKNVPEGPIRAQAAISRSFESNSSVTISAMNDFDRLYHRGEAETLDDLVKNIRHAPGGVIVDTKINQKDRQRLTSAKFDSKTGNLVIRVDGKWRVSSLHLTSQDARAALGFVMDGRVAAIDLRSPPSQESQKSLIMMTDSNRFLVQTPTQYKELAAELNQLTVVNLHPALVDTSIGIDLIGADEIIFQALQTGPIFQASDSRFHGINVEELRRTLTDELRANGLGLAAGNLKSILSVSNPRLSLIGNEVQINFSLRFDVFYIYDNQESPVHLRRVSGWFKHHEKDLIAALPQLQKLLTFASTVTVFQPIIENAIPDELLSLLAETEDTVIFTPRFLCRPSVAKDCRLPRLRGLITSNHL